MKFDAFTAEVQTAPDLIGSGVRRLVRECRTKRHKAIRITPRCFDHFIISGTIVVKPVEPGKRKQPASIDAGVIKQTSGRRSVPGARVGTAGRFLVGIPTRGIGHEMDMRVDNHPSSVLALRKKIFSRSASS